MRFYGREEELQVLQNCLLTVRKKKISQMVTVIGRRRVGKTTLILKAFENAAIPVFYFFVERQSSKEEIIASWPGLSHRISACLEHNCRCDQLPDEPI